MALVVTQDKDDEPPTVIEDGVAVRVQVGAGTGFALTETVALQVTEPPEPVAVPVYVVVATGETLLEPAATGETEPIP